MYNVSKILLSAKELQLVCDCSWILTKHEIVEKVYLLFGEMALGMKAYTESMGNQLPVAISKNTPKISKGENYLRLPYIMLDYPRVFTGADTIAVRCFFWWGKFFSMNLHLSGISRQKAIPALVTAFDELRQQGYYICIHVNPWQHHFNEGNYIPLTALSLPQYSAIIYNHSFIKIAKKISLEQWNTAQVFIEKTFIEMMELVKLNYQGGEKDLLPGTPIAGSDL